MKINDKVIVAFLVSVGLFPAMQAKQYVSTLSTKEKKSLTIVVGASKGTMLICSDSTKYGADSKRG